MLQLVALFAAALVYANILEWCIHKFLLHDLAKKKRWRKLLGFHWYRHHKQSRRHAFFDPDYTKPIYHWNARTKEVFALAFVVLVHLPTYWLLSPIVLAGLIVHVVAYYAIHRKSHLDPAWAKKWTPWHVAHHMGKNQDLNFNVSYPLADFLFRTKVY